MERKRKKQDEISTYKQDIAGIALLALALFILLSNLSSSTGLVGLFFVKKFLKLSVGIGVYILPIFVVFLGITVMIRQDFSKITARITGFVMMFFVIVASAQMVAPSIYDKKMSFASGAGGIIGYLFRIGMMKTIGSVGASIAILAIIAISLLLIFNVTIAAVFENLFRKEPDEDQKRKKVRDKFREIEIIEPPQMVIEHPDKSIESQIAIVKEFPSPKIQVQEKLFPEKIAPPSAPKKRGPYKLPPLDLLDLPTQKELDRDEKIKEATEIRKKILLNSLKSFGIEARIVNISQGPAVTRFEIQPEPGIKVSRIASLSDDISLSMASSGVRIEAPIPGKSAIGIEVPNSIVNYVRMAELAKTKDFSANPSKLLVTVGKDIGGTPIFGDIGKMPHLLIAGTTGSGKSVCINSIIISILMRAYPDEVKFLMIDPKMVELTSYNDIPHLIAPVVTDPKKAAVTLREWAMKEMDRRYKEFYQAGVRNIEAYNYKISQLKKNKEDDIPDRLPYIVVIIDELADLMMIAAAEVETTICRIAQMARATGIHLVVATQRPSVDVLTGLIKANIPSRIAFAVATQVDSRVIMDMGGAEKLLGRGDMLYHPIGAMKSVRLQGTYVSDQEVERVTDFIKEQASPEYSQEIIDLKYEPLAKSGQSNSRDDLFAEAAKIVVESGQPSTSHLQRRMRIGYNRAARLMDELTAAGVVSPPEGDNKPRRILASREMLKQMGVE